MNNEKDKFLTEEEELKCMYLRLKEMAGRLIAIEEMYPDAGDFKEVINKAITELEKASHLIDSEVMTVKDLRWAKSLRGKKRKQPED
ncbi:MAG: hypothetical protein PF545_03460 [Elusimicrobia bacterium]|jgi:hypothetical protein|nr:hypothetical protein [Elusimicrobiota bacterium]